MHSIDRVVPNSLECLPDFAGAGVPEVRAGPLPGTSARWNRARRNRCHRSPWTCHLAAERIRASLELAMSSDLLPLIFDVPSCSLYHPSWLYHLLEHLSRTNHSCLRPSLPPFLRVQMPQGHSGAAGVCATPSPPPITGRRTR